MINISNLERQHKDIWEIFFKIKGITNSKDITNNIDDLVMNINILAGKLNVHMSSEDKYLYPELIESNNEQLKNIAKQYSEEMGNIHNKFNEFKSKFNTKNKILNDIGIFVIESKQVLKVLEDRLNKEDKQLYPQVKSL